MIQEEFGGDSIVVLYDIADVEDNDFNESKAVKNGKFIRLAFDEDNHSELTGDRIKEWVIQLKSGFGI